MKDLKEKIEEEEDKTWVNDKHHARKIVAEILKFGVSQSHITHIINMLALELEDREIMLAIRKSISKDEISDDKGSQILYPGGRKDE